MQGLREKKREMSGWDLILHNVILCIIFAASNNEIPCELHNHTLHLKLWRTIPHPLSSYVLLTISLPFTNRYESFQDFSPAFRSRLVEDPVSKKAADEMLVKVDHFHQVWSSRVLCGKEEISHLVKSVNFMWGRGGLDGGYVPNLKVIQGENMIAIAGEREQKVKEWGCQTAPNIIQQCLSIPLSHSLPLTLPSLRWVEETTPRRVLCVQFRLPSAPSPTYRYSNPVKREEETR